MRKVVFLLALTLLAAVAPAPGASPNELADGDVVARIETGAVVLENSVVERRWRRDALVTTTLKDKRLGGVSTATVHPDFALLLDGLRVTSEQMSISDVTLARADRGGVRVTFTLSLAGLATIVREVEAYPGIAGFAARTHITPTIGLVSSGHTLDEVAVGSGVAPTVHAFRAGADWRFDDGWNPIAIGDAHPGDWRVSTAQERGTALTTAGEWMSLASSSGASAFLVMERRDYASSVMSYDGTAGSAVVDLSRDVVYIGPFEENAHAENPGPGPARHRVFVPGRTVELEPVFTGFGTDPDDEPWQFYRYLTEHRLTPYPKAVTFNTNQVDANGISTGAKDDVDHTRFLSLAAAAREMGVETFVFDDGWQATSGDWCPDSPGCPEPRAQMFPPRFRDDHFAAVRAELAGDPSDPSDDMRLGLWMNPMEFHPSAAAFRANPQWSCLPVGLGTAAVNAAQPDDGSNEAGIGVWNPEALGLDLDTRSPVKLIDYIESRIRRMIEVYGARYFKFDFLVWSDCLGIEPVDMYAYHDSFLAMLDRLQADHPEVTFSIDETNDYRLFPFESVARGPSWFQNGTPQSPQLLHNIWNLAPYVPGFSLGQHALGNRAEIASRGIDYLMAVALGSHITFWTAIDKDLTAPQRAQVKRWTDFYKANRDGLATFTYPLLGDPSENGWTALQPWDPETGSGFLLAYRQGASNPTQRIRLRGVRGKGRYWVLTVDPAHPEIHTKRSVRAEELRTGFDVTALPYTYVILKIDRYQGG